MRPPSALFTITPCQGSCTPEAPSWSPTCRYGLHLLLYLETLSRGSVHCLVPAAGACPAPSPDVYLLPFSPGTWKRTTWREPSLRSGAHCRACGKCEAAFTPPPGSPIFSRLLGPLSSLVLQLPTYRDGSVQQAVLGLLPPLESHAQGQRDICILGALNNVSGPLQVARGQPQAGRRSP